MYKSRLGKIYHISIIVRSSMIHTVPICWNYQKEGYPIDFLRRVHHSDQSKIDTGDFRSMVGDYTEESILDEGYDSDSALVDHQEMPPPASGANITHISMKPMCSILDAQILGKLKITC
jgi:hypothetical protein